MQSEQTFLRMEVEASFIARMLKTGNVERTVECIDGLPDDTHVVGACFNESVQNEGKLVRPPLVELLIQTSHSTAVSLSPEDLESWFGNPKIPLFACTYQDRVQTTKIREMLEKKAEKLNNVITLDGKNLRSEGGMAVIQSLQKALGFPVTKCIYDDQEDPRVQEEPVKEKTEEPMFRSDTEIYDSTRTDCDASLQEDISAYSGAMLEVLLDIRRLIAKQTGDEIGE